MRIRLGEDYLKLSQKAMLLIAVPLAFELLFVGVLFFMLYQAELKASDLEQAKEILSTSAKLTDGFVNAMKALFQFVFSEDEKILKKYEQSKYSIVDNMARIERLLKNDKKTLAKMARIDKTAKFAISLLDEVRRSVEMGNVTAAKDILEDKARPVIAELYADMTRAMETYSRLEENSPQAESEVKAALKNVLLCGVALNIFLAVWLASFFNRSTSARLSILMDNTSRLKAGSQLNEKLDGKDEIAELDQVFHMMAESVTEASERVKRSEARIRAVIAGLPVGVLVLSTEGEIQFINAKAADLFSCSEDKIAGTSILSLLRESKGKPVESFSALSEKTLGHVREYIGIKADKSEIPLDLSLSQYSAGTGFLLGVQDITERYEIERIKKEFVAMVSHDLRTPLTSVQLTLELLGMGRYGPLDAKGQQKVQNDHASCKRLLGLINDLLDIEKFEAGGMALELQLAELRDLFDKTANSVTSFAEKSGVTVLVHPVKIDLVCDPDRMVQVLVNLVSNSIKFSPKGASVELNARNLDGFTEIQVIDYGRGIPEDLKGSIFERFKQVKREDATQHGGTGLGLAICKTIVESHNGTIGVDSELGKGSTFWIRIPNLLEELDAEDSDDDSEDV